MAVIEGITSANGMEVDATFKASRSTLRPMEVLGWYSIAGASGALATVTSSAPVFGFRNIGTNLLLVRKVLISFATTTAFTTAQALAYSMYRATNYSTSDSTGTALYTAGQNKHRSSFANISIAPDIRISATAALTAGTRTLDSRPLGNAAGSSTAVGTVMPPTTLFDQAADGYPLALAQNEGFAILNDITMGAAGVIRLQVTVEFAEVSSY